MPADPKYSALSATAKVLIERKGNLTAAEVQRFTAAGYSAAQIFEAITAIGISTLAATTGNFARTPVEDLFEPHSWVPM